VRGTLVHWPKAKRRGFGLGLAVVVGQVPSRTGDPEKPVTGATGKRLADLAGLSWPTEFVRLFDRVNVLPEHPGPSASGKGDAFPLTEARRRVTELMSELDGRRVLLLGRDVSRCFEMPSRWFQSRLVVLRDDGELLQLDINKSVPAFKRDPAQVAIAEERVVASCVATTFPHPSRVSHWWNDERNEAAARAFMRAYVATLRRRSEL